MLLVIFGAGASYDSVPSKPPYDKDVHNDPELNKRLPLADQLFETRPSFMRSLLLLPKCLPIIPYLRNPAPGRTVESVLEGLQEEGTEDPERYRQLAAIRYYLHLVLWEAERVWLNEAHGVTNYKTLLDQIRHWRKVEHVCLATFNYDRMLEDALPTIGVKIRELKDYVANPNFKIIKLHGSVDWAREVSLRIDLSSQNDWQVVSELIEHAPDLEISSRFTMVSSHPIAKASTGQILFPALAIPVETKLSFECPPEHLEVLGECLPKVEKILVIGWRAMEQHFLTLLREGLSKNVRIMAVSGREDEAIKTLDRIRAAGIEGEFSASDGRFTDFIVKRRGVDFLKS